MDNVIAIIKNAFDNAVSCSSQLLTYPSDSIVTLPELGTCECPNIYVWRFRYGQHQKDPWKKFGISKVFPAEWSNAIP